MKLVECLFALSGKTTVGTGGVQGIGKTVSEYLAGVGANIVIFDMQLEKAQQVAAAISEKHQVKTLALKVDVTNPGAVQDAIAVAAEKMGGLDHLFNNAGICLHKPALEVMPRDCGQLPS